MVCAGLLHIPLDRLEFAETQLNVGEFTAKEFVQSFFLLVRIKIIRYDGALRTHNNDRHEHITGKIRDSARAGLTYSTTAKWLEQTKTNTKVYSYSN